MLLPETPFWIIAITSAVNTCLWIYSTLRDHHWEHALNVAHDNYKSMQEDRDYWKEQANGNA
jgi:hypothetical protein